MTRDEVQRELGDTARLLLDSMNAERRMVELDVNASLEEARAVLQQAQETRVLAMARFKTMCWRLAVHAKEGI